MVCLSGWQASTTVLWLFGGLLFVPIYAKDLTHERYSRRNGTAVGWGLILLAFLLLVIGYTRLSMVIFLTAAAFFWGNLCWAGYAFAAFFVWLVVMPHEMILHYAISQPMREISASVSAFFLHLFGLPVFCDGTNITMEERAITITAACSGIQQLEAMVLAGWIIVLMQHSTTLVRVIHFITVLPIIMLCNVFRVFVTLLGVHYVGNVFLRDTIHTLLGYAMVLLVVVCFTMLWRAVFGLVWVQ